MFREGDSVLMLTAVTCNNDELQLDSVSLLDH